jgi:hypothetical protein
MVFHSKQLFPVSHISEKDWNDSTRVIADITDPDIIQKIVDHIEAQPPPNKPAIAIQS